MKRIAVLVILTLAAALWFFHTPNPQPTHATATPVAIAPVPTPPSAPQLQTITTPVAQTAKEISSPQIAASTASLRMPVIKGTPKVLTLRQRMRSPETLGKIVDDVYDALCVKGPTNGDRTHCDGTQPDISLADILVGMYAACEKEEDCKAAIARMYSDADRRGLTSTPRRSPEDEENAEIDVGAAISESILNTSTAICAEQNLAVGDVLGEGPREVYKGCVPPYKLVNL